MKFLVSRKIFKSARLSKPACLLLLVTVVSLFAVGAKLIAEARFTGRQTERTLAKERQKRSKQTVIPFSRVILKPHFNQNVEILQSTKAARGLQKFL